MTEDVIKLHTAVTAIMRALKIAEKSTQVAHRELNLNAADIAALRYLSRNAGCKLSDLAQYLEIVPTTASSIVDRLVARDFVQRDRVETNRRSVALTLTATGQRAQAALEQEDMAAMRMMLDALPAENRALFLKSMEQIADTFSEHVRR